MYWSFGGIALPLLIAAAMIANKLVSSLTANLVYHFVVLSIILVRYIDIRVYKGLTSELEPATMAHWKKYSIIILLYGFGLWAAMHIISRFFNV